MAANLRIALVALVVLSTSTIAGCDAAKVAEECVAADLVGQCPAGSNPVLGAVAGSTCGGEFDANLVTEEGSATGQCNSNGACEFLCQFEVPCTCGVQSLTKDAIICSECQDQSCGDGRCEGTERATCEAGQQGCFACAEDCAGPTCGDGDCTGDEDPDNCPQDCADRCVPNSASCVGTRVVNCSADGKTTAEFDCGTVSQVCSGGACVAPNVCGNGICDGGESTASCAVDCSGLCTPSSKRCEGNTLVVCSADGKSENETDCGAQICANGQCRQADVCGNSVCEAGEAANCPQDCAAVCGNDVCENNEQTSCPADCTTCGNDTCEAGEITACPQDCGICVPSEKQCLGVMLRVCNANGTAYDDIDCADFQLVCGGGNCVAPDVCGNGVCEVSESIIVCPNDCTETCGNGTCGGIESFQTCSADCDPVCGDGTCEGDEDSTACSFDCLASCGDGACVSPESRVNCPGDCGFCGDGACQDGIESASLTPPQGQQSCVVDCVVTSCGADGDCDDDVACTTNQCRNGACIYTPDDDACGGNDKCIALNGCCGDDDRDGFADAACGGGDCDDGDDAAHPGAIEVCGGGDRNCNGTHNPALVPAAKLTNTATPKKGMTVHDLGDAFAVTWTGKPATRQDLELIEVGWDLLPKGAVKVIDGVQPHESPVYGSIANVAIAWNPSVGKFGASWAHGEYVPAQYYSWDQHFAWITRSGDIDGELFTLPSPNREYAAGAVAYGATVVFSIEAFVPNWVPPAARAEPFRVLDVGGTATQRGATQQPNAGLDAMYRPVTSDGLIAGLRLQNTTEPTPPSDANFAIADLSTGEVDYINGTLAHGSATGDCVMGEDGELLVVVCASNDRVFYHRLGWSGALFSTEQVTTGELVPMAVGKAKARVGETPRVGVALTDRSNNLWFFVRDGAGEEVLAPAIIGGGTNLSEVAVLHDGTDFVVVWLADVGAVSQLFAVRLTCQ